MRTKASNSSCIFLCNLGGPNSLAEVEDFLFSLLSDPYVIRLAWFLGFLQKPLARWIVNKRLPESIQMYQKLGGKSPLASITKLQAAKLQELLGEGVSVKVVMRHAHPNLKQALDELESAGIPEQILVLPLYPQYSTTTTQSSFEQIQRACKKRFGDQIQVKLLKSYPEHPLFIEAWVERIQERLKSLPPNTRIVFSAHSIPLSYVQSGDPYLSEIQMTAQAISKHFPTYQTSLAFQSKFGKGKWLEPSVEELIDGLELDSTVLVVPISFVSDHIETIFEIGKTFSDYAKERNIKLLRVPGLNLSKKFLHCLADLAHESLQ